MDAPLTQDEDMSLLDVYISDDNPTTDNELMKESLAREIQRSLATLTKKERDVINLYYGIGMNHGLTLDEIAMKFDLTRERVRQIKEKAIRRLKHTSRSKLLKAYLGQ
jgi:RNA polymerase primary sigma factor